MPPELRGFVRWRRPRFLDGTIAPGGIFGRGKFLSIHAMNNRVHPSSHPNVESSHKHAADPGDVFTVWKRSGMSFHGTDGFSVFDSMGRLVFRVDNYSRMGTKCLAVGGDGEGDLLLMDGGGRPLLTLRPQILSVHSRWNGFEGEHASRSDERIPIFTMKRRSFFHHDDMEVFMLNRARPSREPDFRIDGSFARRHCKIIYRNGDAAASINRKRANKAVALSDEVFCLTVHPGFDSKLIMAFVVVMDRICHRSFSSWKST